MQFSKKIYRELKTFIYRLDGGRCHVCRKLVTFEKACLDHIIPVALSGGGGNSRSNEYWNLRIIHKRCNSMRGNGRIAGQLRLYISKEL